MAHSYIARILYQKNGNYFSYGLKLVPRYSDLTLTKKPS